VPVFPGCQKKKYDARLSGLSLPVMAKTGMARGSGVEPERDE